MLARVAVVPHPPLMVPQLAAGAAIETEPLRRACVWAAGHLAAAAATWIAVGRCLAGETADGVGAGTLQAYGSDLTVSLRPAAQVCRADLALPFLIAGWLRDRVGAGHVVVRSASVPAGSPPEVCAARGRAVSGRVEAGSEPVGLLILGDGAATHSVGAPGYLDPRAADFEAGVADALAGPDLTGLLEMDAGLATELGAAGREAWQVGAAAAAATGSGWHGHLVHSEQPYGVGYHVAVWEPVR